jgi:hypothetical protein
MARKHKFSDFKIWCSEIYSLLSIPKGIKPKQQELKKFERLLNSDKEKSEEDLQFLKSMEGRVAVLNDPPLSKTTMSALMRQYGWKVYNKKVAATNDPLSFMKKGSDMEIEAVELLSMIDNQQYRLEVDTVENEHIIGRCDVLCPSKDLVVDTKISWNVNSFLKARTNPVTKKHWYQMQGYMELYNINNAEIVFLLLNTPPELIEREKVKLQNKFMIGAIDRDKYELDMENIESAFTYSNIPLKKRHFRYRVKREPQIFDGIYKKVEKSRIWMQDFEKSMKTTIFDVSSENYIGNTEENNTESDTDLSSPNDTGG